MQYPRNFICAGAEYNTFEKHIPAPCFRRTFQAEAETTARLIITACGFYELYLNGVRHTKGALAPYISDTDHILYYDVYDLPLRKGKNVLALLLGNGLQNDPGGYIWDFDRLPDRGARFVWLGKLFQMFPGEDRAIVYFEDTKTKVGAGCVLHPALIRELRDKLGGENVVLK